MKTFSVFFALACLSAASSAAVLFDNGPFVTGSGDGFSGANTSSWTVFNTNAGPVASNIGCNLSSFRVVESFVVPTGASWRLDKFTSFAFRTTTSATFPPVSSFSDVRVAVYAHDPITGTATPEYGDFATNRYVGSAWTGAYRVSPSLLTDKTRPIMAVDADLSFVPTLGPGQYWVEFGLQTTSATSPVYAVGVSPVPTTGNAFQRQISNNVTYAWAPVTTAFTLSGSAVPEPTTLIGLLAGVLLLRRRR